MEYEPFNSLILQEPSASPFVYRRKLRELIQKICLLGLWRSGFFEHAAFYGGTALRLLYELDRFSEDLDFSLLKPNPVFQLNSYIKFVKRELHAWNITAEIGMIDKKHSNITSAFIKANTLSTLLNFRIPPSALKKLHRDEISNVKFELDPLPPCSFENEVKFLLEPIPFSVRVMSLPDLFAGKMHAVLARSWKTRVKGRDWYDLIWFVRNKVSLDLTHLSARLQQSGNLSENDILDAPGFKELLLNRINEIDFDKAKGDVLPFIPNPASLMNWSQELFSSLIDQIIIK